MCAVELPYANKHINCSGILFFKQNKYSKKQEFLITLWGRNDLRNLLINIYKKPWLLSNSY